MNPPANFDTSTSRLFYANLDPLRFFAFLAVFIAHFSLLNLPEAVEPSSILWLKEILKNGVLGVNFFFVLSGFLITILLLNEKQKRHFIDWKKYFIRRTLRIWPLYFLILIMFFIVVPVFFHLLGKSYTETANPIWYLFFMGNYHLIYLGDPYSPVLAVMWSLGVEEQFYLLWPLVFIVFRNKIAVAFGLMIGASLLFRAYLFYIDPADLGKQIYLQTPSLLSDFAIGALLACGIHYGISFLNEMKKMPRFVIGFIYLAGIILIVFYNSIFVGITSMIFERVILGLFFAFIIFEQGFCKNSFVKLGRFRWLNYLGKISYGLYVFHPLAIVLAKDIIASNLLVKPIGYFGLLPLIALLLTIVFAYGSYHYFEKYFLRLKEKFR